MPGVLLSGPAGAGKTQEARRLMNESDTPTVALDFQSLLAALLLLERDANGRYPPRRASQAYALPIAEYLRQAGMTAAQGHEVDTIVTNSDGSTTRRAALLSRMGAGSVERVIDPGKAVVTKRLSSPDGDLSDQCGEAIGRWYG